MGLPYRRGPTLLPLLVWAQSTTVTDVGLQTDMSSAKTRYTSVPRVIKVPYIQNTLSINKWKDLAEAQINHQEDHFHCTPLYPPVPKVRGTMSISHPQLRRPCTPFWWSHISSTHIIVIVIVCMCKMLLKGAFFRRQCRMVFGIGRSLWNAWSIAQNTW